MPFLSPTALANAWPRVMPTSSTVWWSSMCTSPWHSMSRSISPWRAIWSSMCSRKGTPMAKFALPVPSRLTAALMRVSRVLRSTNALRSTMTSSAKEQRAPWTFSTARRARIIGRNPRAGEPRGPWAAGARLATLAAFLFRSDAAMPVYVECPAQLTEQDRQDLLNVYADAPDWLLPPFAAGAVLIERSLADGSLRVARFNGRLLGAARLRPGGDFLRLSHLCVRALTRGRGVARRLVDEARREAQQQDLLLVLAADPAQEAAEQLAAHLMLPLRAL